MTEENGWKTEEYHGAKLMVRAQLRQQENAALDGHGHEWDYLLLIAEAGAEATKALAGDGHAIKSDPDVFYSTQVIAEQMGFIRGRELVEHWAGATRVNPEKDSSAL